MASYHIQINVGERGTALGHAQYIQREGAFSPERYGEVEARGIGNMPFWAREDVSAFWRASDEHERVNGNAYREYELALPRELSSAQRVALVQRFAEQELGSTRPYQWAIHNGMASDGKEQPHVHLMFSDRQLDGIERGPEQFFKRYNSKHPEKGGSRKATYGANKEAAALVYEGIRERWARIQNQALEMAGSEARVDHRSLVAQGIVDREPELHRGPAVSGIEARGEVSEVGTRQREQRQERGQEREAAVAEVRVVTREEMALERVAVRERREMAHEATGEERELVLPLVEADRVEQLQRVSAQAERRIERRAGLDLGEVKEKLLSQARELRQRIGREFERVKEWVKERFVDPLKRVHEQARDLFKQTPKASSPAAREASLDLGSVRAQGRAASAEWRDKLHQRQAAERRAEFEREAQQRQRQLEAQREAQARADRQKTLEQFQSLARSREMQHYGFGDRSAAWRATPLELRQRVEQFNALKPEGRKLALEHLLHEPRREVSLKHLQQLMNEREKLVRSLDHGHER